MDNTTTITEPTPEELGQQILDTLTSASLKMCDDQEKADKSFEGYLTTVDTLIMSLVQANIKLVNENVELHKQLVEAKRVK